MTATPTLVLVHGCGTDGRFWDELLEHLGDVPVIAPSLPGRADSGDVALASAAANAEWLFERLSHTAITDAVVVGHSFGGAIALEMALRKQIGAVTVRGLGLVATGARLRVLPAILEAVTEAVATGVAADLGRYAYTANTDASLIERVEAKARRTPVAATKADWFATDAFDRLGQLDSITVPTCVVAGSSDQLTPVRYAQYLATHIAEATLSVIEGTGHMLPVERPAELARLLVDLLELVQR